MLRGRRRRETWIVQRGEASLGRAGQRHSAAEHCRTEAARPANLPGWLSNRQKCATGSMDLARGRRTLGGAIPPSVPHHPSPAFLLSLSPFSSPALLLLLNFFSPSSHLSCNSVSSIVPVLYSAIVVQSHFSALTSQLSIVRQRVPACLRFRPPKKTRLHGKGRAATFAVPKFPSTEPQTHQLSFSSTTSSRQQQPQPALSTLYCQHNPSQKTKFFQFQNAGYSRPPSGCRSGRAHPSDPLPRSSHHPLYAYQPTPSPALLPWASCLATQ